MGQQIQPIGCEESSVTYLRDAAQEAAEYLSANLQQLGRPGHQEVLERFSRWAFERGRSPGPAAALGQLDEKMARAVVNMVHLQQWDNADAQPGVEGTETGSERKALRKSGFSVEVYWNGLPPVVSCFLRRSETPAIG